ncbi:MAG: hypothetical protein R3341_08275 [Methylophaga sp.]|nr:hypothetical protein [Methylophaga sp.]
MTDLIPDNDFDEAQLQERLELFRYTDLTQPLIKTLFAMQLTDETVHEAE